MNTLPVVFTTTAVDEFFESTLWYANHLASLGDALNAKWNKHWII